MFDKITEFMDTKLSTPMAKLAEQRHLRAIRDGIIATLPIIVVASMFLVIAFLPNLQCRKIGELLNLFKQTKLKSYYLTVWSMYIMTLYAFESASASIFWRFRWFIRWLINHHSYTLPLRQKLKAKETSEP